jgi:hypothetical protein
MNWPNEPPVLTTASARVRRSGGTSRPTAPSTAEKLVAAMPSPTTSPALSMRESPPAAPDIPIRPPT